jgi:hypothetical protein
MPGISSIAERLDLRQKQSARVLVQLRQKLLAWKEQLLLKHPMAEAVNYAVGQWEALNVSVQMARCRSTTMSANGR